jgi:hypothetical protein
MVERHDFHYTFALERPFQIYWGAVKTVQFKLFYTILAPNKAAQNPIKNLPCDSQDQPENTYIHISDTRICTLLLTTIEEENTPYTLSTSNKILVI